MSTPCETLSALLVRSSPFCQINGWVKPPFGLSSEGFWDFLMFKINELQSKFLILSISPTLVGMIQWVLCSKRIGEKRCLPCRSKTLGRRDYSISSNFSGRTPKFKHQLLLLSILRCIEQFKLDFNLIKSNPSAIDHHTLAKIFGRLGNTWQALQDA